MQDTVKSPCISVCVLNEEDICEGCYRSVEEITEWSRLDNDAKRQVMQSVRERFNRLNRHRLL